MRTIESHKSNVCNEHITIEVHDEPGQGGANHRYDLSGFDTSGNPAATKPDGYASHFTRTPIVFQNGPVDEAGVNGITNEALLAVLIDRMEGFQSGDYACEPNQLALDGLRGAMDALLSRTQEREARGVEGTHQV